MPRGLPIRAVDGAVAATFLTALRELIEEPLRIVV
jgi:pyruvate/2-oxoglutarate dehydrogenase complex dihydrolipoamide acyltransferase (E2) component